jgi:hypothetical protein
MLRNELERQHFRCLPVRFSPSPVTSDRRHPISRFGPENLFLFKPAQAHEIDRMVCSGGSNLPGVQLSRMLLRSDSKLEDVSPAESAQHQVERWYCLRNHEGSV